MKQSWDGILSNPNLERYTSIDIIGPSPNKNSKDLKNSKQTTSLVEKDLSSSTDVEHKIVSCGTMNHVQSVNKEHCVNDNNLPSGGSPKPNGIKDSQGDIENGSEGRGIQPKPGVGFPIQSQTLTASTSRHPVGNEQNLPPPNISLADDNSPQLPLLSGSLVDRPTTTKSAASYGPALAKTANSVGLPPDRSLDEEVQQLPLPSFLLVGLSADPPTTKTTEDSNATSTSCNSPTPPTTKDDMKVCLKNISSITKDSNSSIYPIITVRCNGQSLHLLVDTASNCTLVSRAAIRRTNTPSYKGAEISIHGLTDKLTSSSGESAMLQVEFNSRIVPIQGWVVNLSLIHI
mgnify:CR=1 FL=1